MIRRHCRAEGFMLIEVMVAIVVLAVGLLAAFGAFESSRALSLVSERQTTMIHRARQEMERLSSLPYAQLAMSSVPTSSQGPDGAVSAGPPPTLTYGSSTETLVVDPSNGVVSGQPQSWSEGNDGGLIYDFVTWHSDGSCGSACASSQNYKRIVVAITQSAPHGPTRPIFLSTYLTDPRAGPNGSVSNGTQNPLQSPTTSCQNAQGQTVSCTNGLSGNAQTWFLYDTPATQSARQPITGSHTLHPVVTGIPDLMAGPPPPGDASTPVYDLSTDLDSLGSTGSPTLPGGASCSDAQHCGRALVADTTCSATPTSSENSKGAVWASTPLGASLTLTGGGGMTLYTQTIGGVSAAVTLCVAIYDVPGDLTTLSSTPARKLGSVSYQPASYPTSLQGLSFSFDFRGSLGSVTVPGGDRVGVRVWPSSSSQASVGLLYDHPLFASELELNTN